ncbi:Hypothetical protein NTJ_04714 [Nesidiocoris tenuis]|uniref:Uncharacterized protein n=1 Tax=Nesidiocoris tenuis TaxID=355587 RepID=A0ABN7ALZ4_9HEMI|nr:Hypothetical protein NTJ_04714 [Nesidiocoris tenuis]
MRGTRRSIRASNRSDANSRASVSNLAERQCQAIPRRHSIYSHFSSDPHLQQPRPSLLGSSDRETNDFPKPYITGNVAVRILRSR